MQDSGSKGIRDDLVYTPRDIRISWNDMLSSIGLEVLQLVDDTNSFCGHVRMEVLTTEGRRAIEVTATCSLLPIIAESTISEVGSQEVS